MAFSTKLLLHIAFVIGTLAFAAPSLADADPLVGLWAQADEKSGKVQALIRIIEKPPGRYQGFIEKLMTAPGEDPNPRCEDCKDERKNQPVLGMRIITDLRNTGAGTFGGGNILDPDNGDIYRLKISLIDGDQKLDVRGFIGISLFGRSQIWSKASSTKPLP
jgi:uncharacterized protein (DUF2147 family)